MGMRSDVGFCVAPGIEVPRFEEMYPDSTFDKIIRDERGTLYFVSETKWDEVNDELTKEVLKFLNSLHPIYYKLICITEGDVEDFGQLYDNQFGLGYRCEVVFNVSPE